jgi:hypothetical protein
VTNDELTELTELAFFWGMHPAARRRPARRFHHDQPTDPDQLANWLPAPEGPFRFAFRFYGPRDGLVDWSYPMPGIVRQPAE